jgi:hypothetical protein
MTYPWEKQGAKLTDYDIPRVGHMIGVGEDEIHAVLDVESKGYGFDKHGIIRLFEEHVFFRQLPVAKRQPAINLGLAYPKWRKNYANNYNRLKEAYNYDKTAALEATSWGLGQIMGFNHKAAGYDSALEMVLAFAESEGNQLEGMINFIIHAGLGDELRVHDWEGFARGYNGAGYKSNQYDTRLRQRYEFWQRKPDTKWSPESSVKEEAVAEALRASPTPEYAKCYVTVDSVKAYQKLKGLVPDGIIGRNTWAALIKP